MDRRPRRQSNNRDQKQPSEYEQKVVQVARVTRVTGGGKRMRFRALVVIGDKKGKVGFGLAKGADVQLAVNKAVNQAKKAMLLVPLKSGTIAHAVDIKYKSSHLRMQPARSGSGVIAGGPVRAVMEVAGIQNISCKILGASNAISNIRAVFEGFKRLKTSEATRKLRTSKV